MQKGYFGTFGGRYVPEAVMSQLFALECEWELIQSDQCFWDAFNHYRADYMGGESPLWLADNLSEEAGGKIYLKRGDGNETAMMGPALGQILMWKRIGYHKIVAETGRGCWGEAVARAAAVMNMECILYTSCPEQQEKVLERLGARVMAAKAGVFQEALAYWAAHSQDTAMVMTGDWGPYPYTEAVSAFQKVTGEELKGQLLRKENHLPKVLAAGVRTENVLAGLYAPFFEEPDVKLYGAEYSPEGEVQDSRRAGIGGGMKTLGVCDGWQGFRFDRIPGENEPVLGPELAYQSAQGRISLAQVSREAAERAEKLAARTEGLTVSGADACGLALALEQAGNLDGEEYITVFLNQREVLL